MKGIVSWLADMAHAGRIVGVLIALVLGILAGATGVTLDPADVCDGLRSGSSSKSSVAPEVLSPLPSLSGKSLRGQ